MVLLPSCTPGSARRRHSLTRTLSPSPLLVSAQSDVEAHLPAAPHAAERLVKSADGFELTWAVNVLAPFLLTSLLIDKVRQSP